MRKYLRRIARAKMERAGIQRRNKRRRTSDGRIAPSYFASNWRQYAS